ncbi:hypothetical protein RIVM261_078440 [Rivularia sp. IAM M-261]|nr:hypothetical protein RIVM261_078440 [Rivularia sp. IAM M-261]
MRFSKCSTDLFTGKLGCQPIKPLVNKRKMSIMTKPKFSFSEAGNSNSRRHPKPKCGSAAETGTLGWCRKNNQYKESREFEIYQMFDGFIYG